MEIVPNASDNYHLDSNSMKSYAEKGNVTERIGISSQESSKLNNLSICSLHLATEVMQSHNLRVPNLPEPFLVVTFLAETSGKKADSLASLKKRRLVSSSSSLLETQLVHAKRLSFGPDVKESLELTFKLQVNNQCEDVNYQPGDSFGFLCPNSDKEVNALLERLDKLEDADVPCSISVTEKHSSKQRSVSHLLKSSTLREIFTLFSEIRSVPKKVLLAILAENTHNYDEKLCLKFLCSREGSSFYDQCVRKPALCLLDVLYAFKSCNPPVERILEHLPELKPRFYSVASSPLADSSLFRIVFNVVEIEKGEGRCDARKGVCTGWLRAAAKKCFPTSFDVSDSNSTELHSDLSLLSLDVKPQDKLFVFKRKNHCFLLPDDISTPIIMVGPGSGVAPFVGFLQHREFLMENSCKENFGETWLFFGCRYKDKDFLYSKELNRLLKSKVLTNLKISFSRETMGLSTDFFPRYVQDNITHHAKDVCHVIDSGGIIYVCGDAKHMAHDIRQAFTEVLRVSKNIPVEEAKVLMKCLESKGQYIMDIWA